MKIIHKTLLTALILFCTSLILTAQDFQPQHKILVPLVHVDFLDYDNKDFRWTLGLGVEWQVSEKWYVQTTIKQELGRYSIGFEDYFITGKLQSFDLKTGFNRRLLEYQNLQLKYGIYYSYLFAESKNAVLNTPGTDNLPVTERHVFNGLEFDLELTYTLWGPFIIYLKTALQAGRSTGFLMWSSPINDKNVVIEENPILHLGLPFIESLGIQYLF